MGIDVPNIHTVLHWGPPSDLECYVQETGRGGRDGCTTNAILYYAKRDLSDTNAAMSNYCSDLQCRRLMLMMPFCESECVEKPKILHSCCDVCAQQCKCTTCMDDYSVHLSKEDLATFDDYSEDEIERDKLCCEDKLKSKELYSKLMQLRADLVRTEPASVLVGPEILYGFTNKTMKCIATSCLDIKSPEDVQSLGIISPVHAELIYGIVKTFQ